MAQNNQQSSESRFEAFLDNLPIIGPIIGSSYKLIKYIIPWPRKKFDDSGTRLPARIYSDARAARIIIAVALSTGIAAALVSAMIEFQVAVDIYNSQEGLLSFLTKPFKFVWRLVVGGQAADASNIQQDTPRTYWFPFLTVLGFEGSKCIFVLYRYSDQKHIGFWRYLFSLSGAARLCLVVISCFCSVVFFAQLLNKPNEDEINRKIEVARTEIFTGIGSKIENEKNQDQILKDLRIKKGELEQENKVSLLDLRQEAKGEGTGGVGGYGPVAEGIRQVMEKTNEDVEVLDEKIAAREQVIANETTTKANEELDRRTKSIMKDGRALDPKWMSAVLSALYEGFHSDTKGNYTRRWAFFFLASFSLLVSITLELIINEMLKRVAQRLPTARNSNVVA